MTGTIALGRRTDLTVMDVDPFVLGEESPRELPDGRILMAIFDGRTFFER